MKLSDLPVTLYVAARIVSVDSSLKLSDGAVTLHRAQFPGEFDLLQNGSLVTITPQNRGDLDKLNFALSTGRAILAWLQSSAPDGSAELRLALFNGEIVEMGMVDVGLDERAVEGARRALGKRRASMGELIELMTQACAITLAEGDQDAYFLFTAGPAADADFEAAEASTQDRTGPLELIPPDRRSFCIQGDGVRLAVSRKQKSRHEEIYLASRLTRSLAGQSDTAIRLAHSRLSFSDYTRTGQIRALAAGQMAKLLSKQSSYLRAWDEYGKVEGTVLLAHARAIGALKYTKVEPCSEGMTLFLDRPVPENLSVGDELEITKNLPPYLRDPSMEWRAYCELLEEGFKAKGNRKETAVRDSGLQLMDPSSVTAKVRALSEHSVTISLQVQLPAPDCGFFLVFSISGDRVQIQRRMEARGRVLEGRSANPMLGMIIEEDGDIPEITKPPKVPALTNFVKSKVFPRTPPTAMQEEAIRVALNTPDIALIQGPPGTGKTTVIAAILERLNEMSDKRENVRGQILLTGFQHDAVENLMLRLTINSLPVPKFGKRRGENAESSADLTGERVRHWCDQVATRLREKNPMLAMSEQERSLVLLCHQYALAPSRDHAIHMLDEALRLPRTVVDDGLAKRLLALTELLNEERLSESQEGAELLHVIWSMRITAEAFQDDGPERAADVLAAGSETLNEEDQILLKKAVCWRKAAAPSFLGELKHLKRELMDRLTPRPVFRVQRARDDVLRCMAEVMDQIRQLGSSATDKSAMVLAEFLAGLESDPSAIQQAVADYSYAFAATCQQSVGKQIRLAKGNSHGSTEGESVAYDTVIVDEAARVGPRDLLIPMVQARRRIILVGDHRQLPHLIDEEVARALESSDTGLGKTGESNEDSLIQKSMFQYLFKRLDALQKKDGIRRSVTLDQQFRMHPLLGEFVSQNFYAPYHEAFGSPLPAERFVHSLTGTNSSPAIWLDIPASSGKEARNGKSWYRRAEAYRIAEQLHHWIASTQGQRLNFGVITFYKAQTDEIKAALSRYGYTVRAADGSFEVSKEYAFLASEGNRLPEERLRIGTVDAFQGMEFDVVFLSMVRSRANLPEPSSDKCDTEKHGRGLFGHLMSANRLCVSMSRQKRLLVVAGDSRMVTNKIAEHCVPGLTNFYKLCLEKGGLL